MGRICSVGLLILLLLGSTASFGDGGILELRTLAPVEGAPQLWVLENSHLSSRQKASVPLAGGKPEDVYVLESQGRASIRLLINQSGPQRIACDLDGDGSFSEAEIQTATREYSHWSSPRLSLPYSMRLGIPPIVMETYCWTYDEECRLYVESILSYFEGRITLRSVEYAARLVFRSPFPDGTLINEAVILDQNGDGKFDSFTDPWFSSDGIAWLVDSLWVARTTFRGATAEVSLEPYHGPTGRLRIEGQGFHRLHLRMGPDRETGLPLELAYELCLPHGEKDEFTLPIGECSAGNAWLRAATGPWIYYRFENPRVWTAPSKLPVKDVPQIARTRITRDGVASLNLGGPLTDRAKVTVEPFSNRVRLEYEGCTNPAGLEYAAVTSREMGTRTPDVGPPFEIRNRRGLVVTSGNFDYG